MKNYRRSWKDAVFSAVESMAAKKGLDTGIDPDLVVMETPPRPDLGDMAVPLFPFAKLFKSPPAKIGEELRAELEPFAARRGGELVPAGPYLNIRLLRPGVAGDILRSAAAQGDSYGRGDALAGKSWWSFPAPTPTSLCIWGTCATMPWGKAWLGFSGPPGRRSGPST